MKGHSDLDLSKGKAKKNREYVHDGNDDERK